MTRAERQLHCVAVLLELTGLDKTDIATRPEAEQFLILVHALEERGVTLADVLGWLAICDPEGTEPAPGKDPVACFRRYAEKGLYEPPLLSRPVLLWGGTALVGTFLTVHFLGK